MGAAPRIPFLLERRMLSFGVQQWVDIDLTMPSVAIIGPSGWGKSTASASFMGTLSVLYPSTRIWVVDGKGDPAFRYLQKVSNARYYPHRAGLEGLREFHQILQDRMAGRIPATPFCMCWLDELMGLLLLLPKKEQEEVKGMVTAILLQGRAFGMEMTLSVQRPDAHMFDSGGAARESIAHTIALGPISPTMAQMMGFNHDTLMPVPTGAVGAGHLMGPGGQQKPIQVPIIRNWDKLNQAVMDAATR